MTNLPKTQRPRRGARSLLTAVSAIAMVVATSVIAASPAQASDWGGDGDSATCSGAFTVVSTPIYGTRGNLIGKKIAELQMRWSWSCHGNWSRVVIDGGNYPNPVTVEQIVESEGKRAGALDFVTPGNTGSIAWTRYVRLANSQSTACVQAWLSSDFGTPNFHTNGARVCA